MPALERDSREDETRVLVTPAPRGSSWPSGSEAAPAPTEPQTGPDVGESTQDSESWDSLLLKLEREGSQLDEAALDAVAQQLEKMAEDAGNKLQAWQQLGDVYQRVEQTDRAMRAYMRAFRKQPTAVTLLRNVRLVGDTCTGIALGQRWWGRQAGFMDSVS